MARDHRRRQSGTQTPWYTCGMPSVLCAPQLQDHGFAHGFSTRQGGVSAEPYASLNLGVSAGDDAASVAENRRRFAARVGYASERLFELSQVHGAQVRVVAAADTPDALRRMEGDGLVARGGSALGVRTADCLALLLADPVTRTVGAVHAGWRGAAAGVVAAGVQALCRLSLAPPQRLLAALFPHIRVCCFEVGVEVADALAQAAHGAAVVRPGPKPHVDLAGVVRAQLVAAGIRSECIDDVPGCTRCEPERFFSFRRDGQASGRHLAAIVAA
jgi:YfiH family protein